MRIPARPESIIANPSHPVAVSITSGETPLARGGVHALWDVDDAIVRTGRTNDLVRRAGEHGPDPATAGFKFETLFRTDNYAERRRLEQFAHDLYNPPLNEINPISPYNPRGPSYMSAARKFLELE